MAISMILETKGPNYLDSLPIELLMEVISYLGLRDLARLQCTCIKYYNLILMDKPFIFYNTTKFFELYYRQRLFATFLFPFIHPRYSYTFHRVKPVDSTLARLETNNNGQIDDVCPSNTPIHLAASNGMYEIVSRFIRTEQNYNYKWTESVYNEECKMYLHLKPQNASCKLVHLINDEPNTPLHYICIRPEGYSEDDQLKTAQVLLGAGANVWLKGRVGNTCLAEASQHGQLSLVRLILEEYEHSARVNGVGKSMKDYVNEENDYCENAIILAARSHPEVLECLLQNHGNPNSCRRGYSILHIVSSKFHLDRRDPEALSAYHRQRTSDRHWNVPVVASITEIGSDEDSDHSDDEGIGMQEEDITDSKNTGCSPAVDKKTLVHDQVLKLLLMYGADPHMPEPSTGMRPLHTACFWGDISAIEMLILRGRVDPNNELNLQNGWLPIHYACSESQIFAIQTIMSFGCIIWDSVDMPSLEQHGLDEDGSSELPLPVPYYPFSIDTSLLPLGLHVPSPMELLGLDMLKSRIRAFNVPGRRHGSSGNSRRII